MRNDWGRTLHCGSVPDAPEKQDKAAWYLGHLAELLMAGKNSEIEASFSKDIESGDLRFTVSRKARVSGLTHTHAVKQEWVMPKTKTCGYYHGTKTVTSHISERGNPQTVQTKLTHPHLQLSGLMEDIMGSVHVLVSPYGQENLGLALQRMLKADEGISAVHKHYLSNLAATAMPDVQMGIDHIDNAAKLLNAILQKREIEELRVSARHDAFGSYIAVEHHYLNGNAAGKPKKIEWTLLGAQNENGKYHARKTTYKYDTRGGLAAQDTGYGRLDASQVIEAVAKGIEALATPEQWNAVKKEILIVAKHWGAPRKEGNERQVLAQEGQPFAAPV